MQLYLIYTTLAVVIGTGLSWYKVSALLSFLVFTIFAFTLLLVELIREKTKSSILKTIFFTSILFIVGIYNVDFREQKKILSFDSLPVCTEATILESPTQKSHGSYSFTAHTESFGKILVKTKPSSSVFNAGDMVYLSGKLILPSSSDSNGSSFNEQRFLRTQDIYLKLNSSEIIKPLNQDCLRCGLIRTVFSTRDYFLKIHQALLKKNELILMQKTLFGNSSSGNFDFQTAQAIKNLGVSHVFAASGLHLTALIIFFSYILSFFKLPNWGRISLLLFMITFYSSLAAWTPSITRAWMLATLVLVGQLVKRRANLLNIMLFCLAVTLLIDPNSIGDIGFQLSYLATFGIILWTNKITDKMIFIPRSWAEPMAASLAAQILVFPIQIFYFQNIPIYFLPANLLAVPISSLILFGGLTASLVSFLTPIGWLLASGIEILNSIFIKLLFFIISTMDALPGSGLAIERPTFLFTLWLYLLIVYVAFFWSNKVAKHYFMAGTCLIFVLGFHTFKEPTLKIQSFSHKTYEALFLEYKGDKNFFICNTNSRYSAGDHLDRVFTKNNLKSINYWIGNCQAPSNVQVKRFIKVDSECELHLDKDFEVKINSSGVLIHWLNFSGLVLFKPVSFKDNSKEQYFSMTKINFHPSEQKSAIWSQLPHSQIYFTPHCSKAERLELTQSLSGSCQKIMDYKELKGKIFSTDGKELYLNN